MGLEHTSTFKVSVASFRKIPKKYLFIPRMVFKSRERKRKQPIYAAFFKAGQGKKMFTLAKQIFDF